MSSSKAVLTYFAGRGRAEIIRLTMAATGVEWDSVNLTEPKEFNDLKAAGKLAFGQVPLVEYDGKLLVQSGSTARFFAKRGNLLGDNDDELVKIDILFEGARDFLGSFMAYGFMGWDDYLAKAKKNALPKYLPYFENSLKLNGSNGFLVGSRLSLADLALLENILCIEEYFGASELDNYSDIQKFFAEMKSIPAISTYLAGPNRPKKNSQEYVTIVKKVLQF